MYEMYKMIEVILLVLLHILVGQDKGAISHGGYMRAYFCAMVTVI
jgi:hypothetical protein